MKASEVMELLRKAELALASGQPAAARDHLRKLGSALNRDAAALHLLALVEKKLGNTDASRQAFEAALRLAPDEPAVNSNYGNLLESLGESEAALAHHERALAANPAFANARFAKALLLQGLGRFGQALAELDLLIARQPAQARYHSARGSVLRDLGDLAAAAAAYDQSLRLEPARKVALHGRARVALEVGEEDAAERYAKALQSGVTSAEVHLGYAQALEASGRGGEAIAHLQHLLEQQPTWTEGQALLARIRWEAGDRDGFTRGLERLTQQAPQNRTAWRALISSFAGADLTGNAAIAATQAAAANNDDPEFLLLAALYLSEAGRLDQADLVFAALPPDLPNRDLHQASHHLRRGRFDLAASCLDRERARDSFSVAAWALTSVCWRLAGDPRGEWLHSQPGLVATMRLALTADEVGAIAVRLKRLHQTRAHPLGQSLRGGTQTRGRLLERWEPEVRLLRNAIGDQVEAYWAELPAEDPAHPLLRHRSARPVVGGSWSVRLIAGGLHVAHFHTQGVVSSACYLVLPPPAAPMEGWLEIGGAPASLNLPLEPLHRVEPEIGLLALFPSFLFHGTRPFAAGERLTAAFDVVAR